MTRKILVFLCVCLFLALPCYAGTVATSGDTAADVITRVRYDLNDTNSSNYAWSDTSLLSWIDQAVKEIVNRTRCLESGVSNIIVIEDVRSYLITSSYLDVEKAEYDIGLSGTTTKQSQIYDLDRVPFAKLRYGQETEVGNPKAFAVWNDDLYIWPIPRSEQSGNTIYLYTIGLPSGVTETTSTIETPAYFDTAIDLYVKSKALLKDNREETSKLYMTLFIDICNKYRQDIMRREIVGEK